MPFVYFIHEDGFIDCFKIGKTSMYPADRCVQLQTGNPRKLVIYRWIELENHSRVEEYLHAKYASVHIRGEWFHVSKDTIDVECGLISSLDGKVHDCEDNTQKTNIVSVSSEYPKWTDEDIIKVQNEKVALGTYRGKHSPRESMRRKKKYWDANGCKIWNRDDINHPTGFSDDL